VTFYYIVDNVGSPGGNDLPIGTRIFKITDKYPSLKFQFKTGDGPYRTIKELRKESTRFKKLQRDNPQRAQKIYDKKFIINVADKIIVPESIDEQLKGKLAHMLNHVVSGKITKENISGVHFFESKFHRVIEVTKLKNKKGVWEARIEAIRPEKNDWIKKDRPSTFFPTEWKKELLVLKFHEAFSNKKELTETKFVGTTACGIDIVFIIEDNKILSVYPVYD
jgi:hypothetical protein